MKPRGANDCRQLRTLERWRSAELERAQAHHAALEKIVDQRRTDADHVSKEIEALQAFVREQLSGGQCLSADALRSCMEFSALKGQQLKAVRQALEQSQQESDAARAAMVVQFEQLASVEKLLERRVLEAQQQSLRDAQQQLDDQALTRLAHGTRLPGAEDLQEF